MTLCREQFAADGFYLATDPLVSGDRVDAAVAGMDQIRAGRYDRGRPPQTSAWNPGDDPNRLCKVAQPQFANRAIFDLVDSARIGALAAQLTGATMVQVWWVQMLYKPSLPAGVTAPTRIGWHQDRNYWDCWRAGSTLLTAWVALSDVGPDCGPMTFLRGSHGWGHQEGLSDFHGQALDDQRQAIEGRGLEWNQVPALLPAGGVSFHDQMTFHASEVNLSGRPRRSLAIHLRTENAQRNPDQPDQHHTSFIDQPRLCPTLYGSA